MRNILNRLLLCLLLSAGTCGVALAQDVSAQENRKAKLEKEIAIIDQQLATNSNQSKDALARLTLIRKKISNRRELVKESEKEIRAYDDKIYSTQKEINRLKAEVDTLSSHYARLVKAAYKNRDAKIWYMYILAAEDVGQGLRRYNYFRTMSAQMNDQAKKIKVTQAKLEAEREEMKRLRQESEKVKAQRQSELNTLSGEEKDGEKVVSQLKTSRVRYQKELEAKRKEVEALNKEIKRILAAAMKSTGGDKVEIDYKLADEFSANMGKLPWPAEGPVVDKFGQHYHPVYTKLKLPFNNGINIALSPGTQIKAVFNGVVKQIVVMPGYNQCVLVQHGNYFTFYCKLKNTSVKAGDTVKTGQVLGTVDTINGETQLHFQIWKEQSPQNPELWLR